MKKDNIFIIVFSAISIVLTLLTIFKMKKEFDWSLEIKNALHKVYDKYGKYMARDIERLYRLETNHFKSNQFKKTFSAGMMKFAENFPYGWNALNNYFWKTNPQFAPTGVMNFKEGAGLDGSGGGIKEFLKFPTLEAAMLTTAANLEMKGAGNPGAWYSNDVEKQAKYNKALGQITPVFVNEFI